MDRNNQKINLVNVLVLALVGGVSVWLARTIHSSSGMVAAAFIAVGFLVALLGWFQSRLEAREQIEQLEIDELNRTKGGSTLFGGGEAELRPARRAREQFERIFVPTFTVLLFFLQAGFAFLLWNEQAKSAPLVVDRAPLALALFALFSLTLFLLGKYSAGVARLEKLTLLRPAAGNLMLGAILCAIVALALAGVWFGIKRLDFWVARAFCALLTLAATENLINLVLEIYRPRVKGQAARLLYESRLIGLLTEPGGVFKTLAHTLDYQFGFKVSDTWFYRFLEGALAWIVLLQFGALLLFTTFVIIEPGEEGLLERFGRPMGQATLGPGLHFKLPWPVEIVRRFRTSELQQIEVGYVHEEDHGHGHEVEEKVVLWTRRHEKDEFNLLVASRGDGTSTNGDQTAPVNLLSTSIPIQFQITNLTHWAYGHENGAELLTMISSREVVRYMVSVDYDDVLAGGRLRAAKELQEKIQARANALQLGVKIVLVGLEDIHPPVAVAGAYEAVIGSLQEKESKILNAEGFRAETLPLARAEAEKKLSEAQTYRASRITGVAAQATQFTNQMAAYDASPAVFTRRLYLDTVSRALGPVRKIVLGVTNTTDVINLNLEEKIRTDLLDVTLPGKK